MTGEKVDFDEADADRSQASKGADGQVERSTIGFPYLDLDVAVEVARAVYNRSGLGSCEVDELAAEMSQTVSGAFRLKTATAKIFDLVDKDGRSAFRLTQLGRRLVSEGSETDARAEAFLAVPLYKEIYDQYRGHNLPPAKALEREMRNLGVSSKQTDKARQAFERSARQAGYFDAGENRLVRPRSNTTSPKAEDTPSQEANKQTGSKTDQVTERAGNGGDAGLHPFIQGLLQTLPEPDTVWSVEGRAAWLETAANCFTLMYKGEGKITVLAEGKVGDKSEAA